MTRAFFLLVALFCVVAAIDSAAHGDWPNAGFCLLFAAGTRVLYRIATDGEDLMNAYLVRIPEERSDFPSVTDLEPPEPWWPTGVFVAATPAQAKRDALDVWTRTRRTGVNSDDWPALRVRLLERDVDLLGDPVPRGELADESPHFDRLWGLTADLLAVAA